MAFFNSKGKDDMTSRSPLPAGEYVCEIEKTEYKQTKNKAGMRLSVQFKVVQGDYAGKYIFGGYNLEHTNVTTVEMSQKEFATLIRAVFGNDRKLDSHEELRGRAVNVSVKIKGTDEDEYGRQNEITGYDSFSSGGGKKGKKDKKGKKGKKGGKPW